MIEFELWEQAKVLDDGMDGMSRVHNSIIGIKPHVLKCVMACCVPPHGPQRTQESRQLQPRPTRGSALPYQASPQRKPHTNERPGHPHAAISQSVESPSTPRANHSHHKAAKVWTDLSAPGRL